MRSSLILSVVLTGCLAAVAGCGSGDGYKYKASTGAAGSEESSGGTGGRSDASAGEATAGGPNATGGSEDETGGAENGTGGDTPAGGEPGSGGSATGGEQATTGGAGGTDAPTGGTGGSEPTAGAAGGFSGPEYLASYTFDTTVEGFEILGLSDAAPGTTLQWVNEGSPAPGALQVDGTFTDASATQTITVSLDLDHVDWSEAGQISADIRILEGTLGGYMLFLQAIDGSTWTWENSSWTGVASLGSDWTTITWDLSEVGNLDNVVRVGLQWHSGSGSTESVSFQLDSIVVTKRQEQGAGGAGGEGGAPGNTGGAEPTAGAAGAAGDGGMAGSAGAAVVNLFPNSGFEDGTTTGWAQWNSGSIAATTETVHQGTYALAHTDRTGTNAATTYSVLDLVEAGSVYDFSLWLTIGGAETATVHLTSAIRCDDAASSTYEWFVGNTTITEGEWVQLVGTVDLSACTELDSVTLYAEGADADVDVYIDDVALVLVSSGGTGGAGGEGGAGGATGAVGGTGGATGGSDTGGAAGAAGAAGAGTGGEAGASIYGMDFESDVLPHGGDYAMVMTGRTANAPAVYDLTSAVAEGETFDVEIWASVGNAASADVGVMAAITCDGDQTYQSVVSSTAVTAGEWAPLLGTLDLSACTNLTEALLYLEGPGADVDVFVDDVVVSPVFEGARFDFEDQVATGWSTWGGGTIATTDTLARGGDYGLLHTGRGANAPTVYNFTSRLSGGSLYAVSWWTTLGATVDPANVTLTAKVQCDGGSAAYRTVRSAVSVTPGTWTELTGTVDLRSCTTLNEVSLYVEGPAADVDMYLDDVTVTRVSLGPNIVSNGAFEGNTADGWYTWGTGSLAATDTTAHTGTYALLHSGRTDDAPTATSLTTQVEPGATYSVTVWATITGAESAALHVTRSLGCNGAATTYSWLGGEQTISDGVWTQFTGTLDLSACATIEGLQIYAQGPASGVDVLLDDVSVTRVLTPAVNVVENGDFEDGELHDYWTTWGTGTFDVATAGSGGWFTLDTGNVLVTDTQAHGGSKSVMHTNRTDNEATQYDATALLEAGATYSVSLWTTVGGADADVGLSAEVTCDSGSATTQVLAAPVGITAGTWAELGGTLDLSACTVVDQVLITVDGPGADVDVYVDDVAFDD